MDPKKLAFSSDVLRLIKQLGKVIFDVTASQEIENIFGLTKEQLKIVVHKIVNALPDICFAQDNTNKMEALKTIVAREFIFFQVQEKWNDPHYQTDLANFIRTFSKDIEQEFLGIRHGE